MIPDLPDGLGTPDRDGTLLVVGEPAVGFAHISEVDGRFNLERIVVRPDQTRQGRGTELVYAAVQLVATRGGDALSLAAFTDVPGNEPFFRALGFAPVEQPAGREPVTMSENPTPADKRIVMMRPIAPGVVPRPAVSVIPVRDGDAGLEVFVQHRVQTMDFAPGVVVFPGGRVDPVDAEHAAQVPDEQLDELVDVWRDSAYVRQAEDPRFAVRVILATGIREVAEETGVQLRPDELIPWDDWTTPPGVPKRFQVHFMVAHLPSDDERSPQNTTTEAFKSEWLPVSEVLRRGATAELKVMTPTRVILEELEQFGDVATVLAACPEITPVLFDHLLTRPRPRRNLMEATE